MEIFSAFIVGLFGSFHCIGMCGPIALALPVAKQSNLSFFSGRILYNLGRSFSYVLMGLIVGFIGEKLIISGYQQVLSILLGLLVLVYVFLPAKLKAGITNLSFIQLILASLKTKIYPLLRNQNSFSLLLIGFLNGFLPCGFVYIGLAGAISTGNPFDGMIFMFLFGLGTFPVMFAVSIFGKFVSINFRQRLSKLTPVFAVLFACIFILRGLNLGIPYLSPKLDSSVKTHQMMHH
jgi:sulfite exporter TauE/SafE